jgi:hypothetical protein
LRIADRYFFERWKSGALARYFSSCEESPLMQCNKSSWSGLVRMATVVVWAGAQAVLPVAFGAPSGSALPQRNLTIEWRVNVQGTQQHPAPTLQRGQVLLDTRRGATAQVTVRGGSSLQTDSEQDSVQQVQVLNGRSARLYVGRSQPQAVWQWAVSLPIPPGASDNTDDDTGSASPATAASAASTPWGQLQMASQTRWVDVGQGVTVRPRWSGGRTVLVEVDAQSSDALGASAQDGGALPADAVIRRTEVMSTLTVPMGQWTPVARRVSQTLRQTGQRTSATLSTRELRDDQSTELEIRITAP